MPSLRGGGAERSLITILNNIDYSLFTVELCLLYHLGEFLSEVPENVRVFTIYKKPTYLTKKIGVYIYKYFHFPWFEVIRIMLKTGKNYDAIISFLEGGALKFHSYIHHRTLNNISWIHTDMLLNHYTNDKSFSQKHEAEAYGKMNKLVFVSKEALTQFEKVYTVSCKKVVIYNIVDKIRIMDQSIRYNYEKRKFTICSVGSLEKVKGYDRLLRVAKRLKDDGYDLDFWIIGDGSLKDSLIEDRNEKGLEDTVHFFGFKDPPYPYMKSADIFLLTSRAEGFSIVIGEALCLGLPVVSTNCTGPRELLGFGEYGVLTSHEDDSIVYNLKSLIDYPDELKRYRELARVRSEIFDFKKTISEVNQLFNI
jgi:glycosyltransferase involved in cell wall biosynthesis